MGTPDDKINYVKSLRMELEKLGVTVPKNFDSQFLYQAYRLGDSAHVELGSMFLIECLSSLGTGAKLTGNEVEKILDRVRHRIYRQAAKWNRHESISDENIADSHAKIDEQRILQSDYLKVVLKNLTPLELYIVEGIASGKTSTEIASETELGADNVRQLLSRLRRRIRNMFPKSID